MKPLKRPIALLIIFVILLPGHLCFAWSEGGHHLIAAVAFSLLTDKEKNELLDVLKKHPRFDQDFNHELKMVGEKAVSAGLDPQIWLEESRQLAVQHVYTPVVIENLDHVARGLVSKPEVIELPEDYFKNAGRVAQIRATEAGYRLAAVWRECLGELGE